MRPTLRGTHAPLSAVVRPFLKLCSMVRRQQLVAREGSASDALVGRCQGARWRRVARYLMAIWLGALFIQPDVLRSQSLGSRLHAIAITAVVVAACDIWFARRMGLTVDERGMTLYYAFHRRRVPWPTVQGFEWRRWNSPRSEWIWITRGDERAIRIPTVQRSPGGEKRAPVYRWLASERMRITGGAEVEAMATLERARGAMHNEADCGRRTPTA
jgi:hypothetical protein